MYESSFLEFLSIGSFLIAVGSGALIGTWCGMALLSSEPSRFAVRLGAICIVSIAAQYGLWAAMASGTTTMSDGTTLPSGVGASDLAGVLIKQAIALASAFYLVRREALRQSSVASMAFVGTWGAPIGLAIGWVATFLLGLVGVIGCFAGAWSCGS